MATVTSGTEPGGVARGGVERSPDSLRRWSVAGAVLRTPTAVDSGSVLLVRNRRRDGREDWTPPGGVIEHDEVVLDGLAREVREETGLAVARWESEPLYRVGVEAVGLGWHLEVTVFAAANWEGELCTGNDPDGLVVEGRWVDPSTCRALLRGGDPWVREPLESWLDTPWSGTRRFDYRLSGRSRAELRVERR
ncbi:MAG: NUDIX hydrolase [Acidimicrobiia bacterium]|nr:NUDIX hydrolase [Acidimicrobiia bacterium]